MYTIRIEAWCPFNPPSCTDLHIQTDTDWQTVPRLSVMFETVLANAYLVNDAKRLHLCCTYELNDVLVQLFKEEENTSFLLFN